MSPTAPRLLVLLCDGRLHSGAQLAAALGVSRAAVWKLVGELRKAGVAIESLSRRGYRLPAPVELLDAARMRAEARTHEHRLPDALAVHFLTDSTNEHLHAAPPPPPGVARVAFAELQSAGRGRRGRSWIAPFGSGLTFSIAWTFAETPADLPALGLALGVAIAKVLRGLGAQSLTLKWPNDLLHDGRKLGGLLTQLRQEAGGAATVVAGLGLNLVLPADARLAIDQSAQTSTIIRLRCPSRISRPRYRAACRRAMSSPHVSSSVSRKHSASSQPGATPALPETGPRSMRFAMRRCACTRAATGSRAPRAARIATGRCWSRVPGACYVCFRVMSACVAPRPERLPQASQAEPDVAAATASSRARNHRGQRDHPSDHASARFASRPRSVRGASAQAA